MTSQEKSLNKLKENLMIALGKRVQEIRESKGLSQVDLAGKMLGKFDTTKELYNEVSSKIDIEVFNIDEAKFERFFGYNQNEVSNLERFNTFLKSIEKAIEIEKNIIVEIEASASKVPTRTFRTNTRLAKKRASVSRNAIEDYFKAKNIDITNAITFKEQSKVQGPDYKGDFEKNRATYENFQFVKIDVLKAKE